MAQRLSDRIRNLSSEFGHVPLLEKLRYPILRDLYREYPFIGPAFQLVKLFEDFWSSLRSIFKSAKTPKKFDHVQLINGFKMASIHLNFLIISVFAPLVLIATSQPYRHALIMKAKQAVFVERYFNLTLLIQHFIVAFLNWVSALLEGVLGLVRGVVLMATSVPLFVLYPIRFLIPKGAPSRIVDGRKLKLALDKSNIEADPSSSPSWTGKTILNIIEVMMLFTRRLESKHLQLSPESLNAYNTLREMATSGKDSTLLTDQATKFLSSLKNEVADKEQKEKPITLRAVASSDILLGKESHCQFNLIKELPEYCGSVVDTSLCNNIDYNKRLHSKLTETLQNLPELHKAQSAPSALV